jgi:hypothetical protein
MGMSMSPEQLLWQTVIEKAFVDATNPEPANKDDIREKARASAWIRNCGRDFRFVCSLAGLAPQFLSDAFNANRVDREIFRNSSKIGRKSQ